MLVLPTSSIRALAAVAAALIATSAQGGELYRHVDANGVVTFADRPQSAGQAGEKQETRVNVATPAARRQFEQERAEALARTRRETSALRQRESAARSAEAWERARAESDRGLVIRHEPNLPDTPPPDSTRRYYYK